MPIMPGFLTTEILFACTGIGFALTKVSVYSSVGLLAANSTEHGRMINSLEGVFMLGVLVGNWVFASFIDAANPGRPTWLNVYWLIAILCVAVIVLLLTSRLDESGARAKGETARTARTDMLMLLMRPLVFVFLISAFLYVLIEQSFGTWLPTFNKEVLRLPNAISIQFASILAGATAVGRLAAGQMLRRMPWHVLLNACVAGMALLIVIVLPLAGGIVPRSDVGWLNAPLAAYMIPLIGLLMAPIYPVINSVILTSLPKPLHAAMTGLIVVFSALGGTLGSRITAVIFAHFDGVHAFYFSLVPMALLMVAMHVFRCQTAKPTATLLLEKNPEAV
jgi:fucose permease